MPRERLSRIEQDYRDAINHIYGLAHNVCCERGEQTQLISALQDVEYEMTKQGETGKAIVLCLMGLITTGLAFGNWPWSPKTADEIIKLGDKMRVIEREPGRIGRLPHAEE